MDKVQLANLVDMGSPANILDEVCAILYLISPGFDVSLVDHSFHLFLQIYKGSFPGYQACNTEYHDLRHITDTILAMIRLVHGAVLDGRLQNERLIALSLTATLMHDVGYIQEEGDDEGTGAKYTADHVPRSANFLEEHQLDFGIVQEEADHARFMIHCTDINVDLDEVTYPDKEVELLGKLLAAADLLAQMADRIYLEKLLFLYREFEESNLGGYTSAVDFLQKTIGFYEVVLLRFATLNPMLDHFLRLHFATRWNISKNLYDIAIQKHRQYLRHILSIPDTDPLDHLRRSDLVEKFRRYYANNSNH